MRKILASLLLVLVTFGCAAATVNEVFSRNDYVASGSATIFPYTFKIFTNADIEVIVAGITQTLNTHYSVSGLGASGGGNVTFVTAPSASARVALLRKQPQQQLSNYVPNEAFPATRLMGDFDKQTMLSQMQAEQLARSLHIPKYVYPFNAEFDPTGNGGKCIGINQAVSGITTFDCSGGGGGGPAPTANLPFINVKENGVVGNGAVDDTAAFAAIMSGIVGGAQLYFPCGVYKANIVVNKHAVWLSGAGLGCTTIMAANPAAPAVQFTGSYRSKMSDMAVTFPNNAGASGHGLHVLNSSYFIGEKLYIYGGGSNFLNHGIVLQGTTDIQLKTWLNDIEIVNGRGDGIKLTGTSESGPDARVVDTRMRNIRIAGSSVGLDAVKIESFVFGVTIDLLDAPAWGNWGVNVAAAATTTTECGTSRSSCEFHITNSVIDEPLEGSIKGRNSTKFWITGNPWLNAKNGGGPTTRRLDFDNTTDEIYVKSNYFPSKTNTGIAIYINARRSQISENTIIQPSGTGITLDTLAIDANVQNNKIYFAATYINNMATGNLVAANWTDAFPSTFYIGDDNFFTKILAGDPIINFEANSFLQFNRTSDDLRLTINNVAQWFMNNGIFSLLPSTAPHELRFRELAVNGSEYVGWKAPDSITTAYTNVFPEGRCLSGQIWQSNGGTPQVWSCQNNGSGGGGTLNSITGTTNRITISGTGTDPIVDIASTYVGQTSITTLGTVTAGRWNVPGTDVTTGFLRVTSILPDVVAATGALDFQPAFNATRLISRGANAGTQGQFRFITTRGDGTADINAISVNSLGNVGIKTDNPQTELHVAGNILIPYNSFLYAYNNVTSAKPLLGVSTNGFGVNVTRIFSAGDGITFEDSLFNTRVSMTQAGGVSVGTGGGIRVGNSAGGIITDAVNSIGGFYENGVKVGASGIIGSGLANQCAYWTGASSIGGSNSCLFDPTNIGLALTKSSTNATRLFSLTTTNTAPSYTNSRPFYMNVTQSGARTQTGGGDVVNDNTFAAFYIQNTDSSTAAPGSFGDRRISITGLVRHTETAGFQGAGQALAAIYEQNGSTAGGEKTALGGYTFLTGGSNGSGSWGINGFLGVTSGMTSVGDATAVQLNELNCNATGGAQCSTRVFGNVIQHIDAFGAISTAAAGLLVTTGQQGGVDPWVDAIRVAPGASTASTFAVRNDGGVFVNVPTTGTTTVANIQRNSVTLLQVLSSLAASETSVLISVNNGAVVTRRVNIAGPSSCGAGLRCLVVAD